MSTETDSTTRDGLFLEESFEDREDPEQIQQTPTEVLSEQEQFEEDDDHRSSEDLSPDSLDGELFPSSQAPSKVPMIPLDIHQDMCDEFAYRLTEEIKPIQIHWEGETRLIRAGMKRIYHNLDKYPLAKKACLDDFKMIHNSLRTCDQNSKQISEKLK